MLDSIRGQLTFLDPPLAVVEANGVGYALFVPQNLPSTLTQLKEEVQFYVTLVIRENAHSLYGFKSRQDRTLFDLLLAISGIGPKTALGIIEHFPLPELKTAIDMNNAALLSKIPGIGKKTAERLILELSDKLPSLQIHQGPTPQVSTKETDAVFALINLGYPQKKATEVVLEISQTPENPALADVITLAIKRLTATPI